MISLSCRGLERCGAICDQEVVFVGHNFEYTCKAVEACFLSPRVCASLQADRAIDCFNIDYDGDDGREIFEALESLVRGNTVDLGKNTLSGLLRISTELGNDEIVDLLSEGSDSTMELDTICYRLEVHAVLGGCDSAEIEFAASHFYEIDEESLSRLPVCILESILTCESLRLKDEDSLLRFLNTIDGQREVLYRYLKCEYLSCESIRILLGCLEFESLDCMIWSSLCHRLLLRVCDIPSEFAGISKLRFMERVEELPFADGLPFNGILSFLRTKYGGNIHTKGAVDISASSDEHNHCWQVADHGWTGYWHTNNERDSWIAFDFKHQRVSLSHYTLKSHPGTARCLQDWMIEGSNDGKSWIELDRRANRDLVGNSIVKTYPCSNASSAAFRHLRMRQTGPTSHNDHYFILTNIEFFGRLTGPQ